MIPGITMVSSFSRRTLAVGFFESIVHAEKLLLSSMCCDAL
jgi:hypothetical protein